MFSLIKPGHVLRFGTDPSTIISPPGVKQHNNDNTLATAWPMTSDLGLVQCFSHPSGPIGTIAASMATRLRTTPSSLSRMASYSAPGRFLTSSDRPIAGESCNFVGYVDGQSNYIQSTRSVFSKDFSGCLMVAYTVNGQRHVAHAAASSVANMDCKQAFLTTLHGMGAVLIGWFRPFTQAQDADRKISAYGLIKDYIANQIDNLTTFGVITSSGQAYSIDAFKPKGITGNNWIVTYVSPRVMRQNWTFTP